MKLSFSRSSSYSNVCSILPCCYVELVQLLVGTRRDSWTSNASGDMHAYARDYVHRCWYTSRRLRESKCIVFLKFEVFFQRIMFHLQALDLWMAGCMIFVFAALAEFVVVKVLDVQYQQQAKQTSKPILPLRLTSTMEKGQCQTVAVFDGHGTNVRSRKPNTQTPTTPVQVMMQFPIY